MDELRKVYLVGTSHKFQIHDCSAEKPFERMIKELCVRHQIKALGEEMSLEALQKKSVERSICEVVATSLGLPHKYCDPDTEERKKIGVTTVQDSVHDDFMKNPNDKNVQNKTPIEIKIREEFWLNKLLELDFWPILFVCGACHVESFSRLLTEKNKIVDVLHEDWSCPDSNLDALQT